MKYRIVPATDTQKKLHDEVTSAEISHDVLSEWLMDFHRDHEAEWAFQVQLLEDGTREDMDELIEYAGAHLGRVEISMADSRQTGMPTSGQLFVCGEGILGGPHVAGSVAWVESISAAGWI